MRTFQRVRENPWKKICQEEWKRAKGIIRFDCRRPIFLWKKMKGHRHAEYSRSGHSIHFRSSIKDLDISNQEVQNEFRRMIRHEIAHIKTRGHGNDFMVNLERLAGSRYSGFKLPTRKRKPKERYTASWPTGETSTYYWTERQMKKMVHKFGFIDVRKLGELN